MIPSPQLLFAPNWLVACVLKQIPTTVKQTESRKATVAVNR